MPTCIKPKRYSREIVHYRRKLLQRFKRVKGCKACGYNKQGSVLHFDHLDPSTKRFGLASSHDLRTRTINVLKAEMAKCQVLCANCHSEKTHADL